MTVSPEMALSSSKQSSNPNKKFYERYLSKLKTYRSRTLPMALHKIYTKEKALFSLGFRDKQLYDLRKL